MFRQDILKAAANASTEERQKAYGDPWTNLTNCAGLWQAYLQGKYGGRVVDPMQFLLSAEDVAHMNVLQKMARTFSNTFSSDTYIDMAAYAAIAGEVAAEDARE